MEFVVAQGVQSNKKQVGQSAFQTEIIRALILITSIISVLLSLDSNSLTAFSLEEQRVRPLNLAERKIKSHQCFQGRVKIGTDDFRMSFDDLLNIPCINYQNFLAFIINSMNSQAKQVGKYIISMDEELGNGASSVVYKAHETSTKKAVAVKVMAKNGVQPKKDIMEDFSYELHIMMQLKSENIIQVLDVAETKNNFYAFLEFAQGGTLRAFLRKEKILKEDKAISMFTQILNGFKVLSEKKVTHRDIKPENILIHTEICKIADFGFAAQDQEEMTDILGSPAYMSPEILKGISYSSKCDIWALGVILYEMVCGKLPYLPHDGDFLAEINKKELSFPKDSQISVSLKEFIKGCLKKEEVDRLSWEQIFNHELFRQGLNHVDLKSYEKQAGLLRRQSATSVEVITQHCNALNQLRHAIDRLNIDCHEAFRKADASRTKCLNKVQMELLIQNIIPLTKSQTEKVFGQLKNQEGLITFSSFIKAVSI